MYSKTGDLLNETMMKMSHVNTLSNNVHADGYSQNHSTRTSTTTTTDNMNELDECKQERGIRCPLLADVITFH